MSTTQAEPDLGTLVSYALYNILKSQSSLQVPDNLLRAFILCSGLVNTPAVIFLGLYYVNKCVTKSHILRIAPESEFKVFVAACILAQKYLEDYAYSNRAWSKVSMISVKELFAFELELLKLLEYELSIKDDDFRAWLRRMRVFSISPPPSPTTPIVEVPLLIQSLDCSTDHAAHAPQSLFNRSDFGSNAYIVANPA